MLLPGDNLLQNRFRNTVQKGPYSGVQSRKNGNFISSVPLSFNKTHTPGKQYSQLDAEQSFSEAVSITGGGACYLRASQLRRSI